MALKALLVLSALVAFAFAGVVISPENRNYIRGLSSDRKYDLYDLSRRAKDNRLEEQDQGKESNQERREEDEKDEYPLYAYQYFVKDTHTGDIKSQKEVRDGDVVRGEYSLVEADGSIRQVYYHANDHDGFNVIIRKV